VPSQNFHDAHATTATDFHHPSKRRWYLALWFASISGNSLLIINRTTIAIAGDIPQNKLRETIVPAESFDLDEYIKTIASLRIDSSPTKATIERQFIANLIPTPTTSQPTTIIPSSRPIAPKIIPSNRVQPNTTTWIFNGTPVNHLTTPAFSLGTESGSNRNPLQSLNSILNLGGQTTEITDAQGIYNLDYRGTFSQIQTLRQSRQVLTDITQPSTLIGFRERLTLTADCILPGTPKTAQCSYLPGLVTDRSSINNNQQPTRINLPSQFGEIVTPASLAAIKQPGFEAGANGQNLGIDLYFPNAGSQPGNKQSDRTIIDRREELRQTPALSSARIHQTIRIGDREAAIGRTIRGNAYIQGDDNLGIFTGLQFATESLPEAIPALPPATGKTSTINRNLLKTADFARLPENSFTLYHYGIGRAPHAPTKVAKITDIPAANYQGWWIGLSPVIDRTQTRQSTVQLTGPQQIVREFGVEGGSDAANVNIRSTVNGVTFDARQLQNVYQQAYITAYQQDATIYSQSKLIETTKYYPHFSYTGNITNSDAVFRYYAGAIVENNGLQIDGVKTYAGLDYTQITDRGLSYGIGGAIYTNPNPEYHSYAIGNISQKIDLSPKNSLNLAASINYVPDGQITVDKTLFRSANSSINIGANLNLDRFNLGIAQSFASRLPNSIGDTFGMNLSVGINDNLSIAGYWKPWSEEQIRSPYGISANLRLGKDANSPSLSLGWNQNTTDFGRDAGNRSLQQQDNIFTVLFKLK
jgi:hypothetical protein